MKKLLITSVSSLIAFSAFAHADTASPEIDFDKVQAEWQIISEQLSIRPSLGLYSGDFQTIANQQVFKSMYSGDGASKMISVRWGRF